MKDQHNKRWSDKSHGKASQSNRRQGSRMQPHNYEKDSSSPLKHISSTGRISGGKMKLPVPVANTRASSGGQHRLPVPVTRTNKPIGIYGESTHTEMSNRSQNHSAQHSKHYEVNHPMHRSKHHVTHENRERKIDLDNQRVSSLPVPNNKNNNNNKIYQSKRMDQYDGKQVFRPVSNPSIPNKIPISHSSIPNKIPISNRRSSLSRDQNEASNERRQSEERYPAVTYSEKISTQPQIHNTIIKNNTKLTDHPYNKFYPRERVIQNEAWVHTEESRHPDTYLRQPALPQPNYSHLSNHNKEHKYKVNIADARKYNKVDEFERPDNPHLQRYDIQKGNNFTTKIPPQHRSWNDIRQPSYIQNRDHIDSTNMQPRNQENQMHFNDQNHLVHHNVQPQPPFKLPKPIPKPRPKSEPLETAYPINQQEMANELNNLRFTPRNKLPLEHQNDIPEYAVVRKLPIPNDKANIDYKNMLLKSVHRSQKNNNPSEGEESDDNTISAPHLKQNVNTNAIQPHDNSKEVPFQMSDLKQLYFQPGYSKEMSERNKKNLFENTEHHNIEGLPKEYTYAIPDKSSKHLNRNNNYQSDSDIEIPLESGSKFHDPRIDTRKQNIVPGYNNQTNKMEDSLNDSSYDASYESIDDQKDVAKKFAESLKTLNFSNIVKDVHNNNDEDIYELPYDDKSKGNKGPNVAQTRAYDSNNYDIPFDLKERNIKSKYNVPKSSRDEEIDEDFAKDLEEIDQLFSARDKPVHQRETHAPYAIPDNEDVVNTKEFGKIKDKNKHFLVTDNRNVRKSSDSESNHDSTNETYRIEKDNILTKGLIATGIHEGLSSEKENYSARANGRTINESLGGSDDDDVSYSREHSNQAKVSYQTARPQHHSTHHEENHEQISDQETQEKGDPTKAFSNKVMNNKYINDHNETHGGFDSHVISGYDVGTSNKTENKTKIIKEEEELDSKDGLSFHDLLTAEDDGTENSTDIANGTYDVADGTLECSVYEPTLNIDKGGEVNKRKEKEKTNKEKPAKPAKPTKPTKPAKSTKSTKTTKNEECPNGKCDWDGISLWGRLMNGIRKETCAELMDRIVERTVYATPTFANTMLESPFTEVCLDKFIQADDKQNSFISRSYENMINGPKEIDLVDNKQVDTPPAGMNVKLFCRGCDKYESKSCL